MDSTSHWRQLPAALWTLVCAVLLLSPGQSLPAVGGGADKIGHFALFFVQAWLLAVALAARRVSRPRLTAVAATIGYSAVLEWTHLWLPGRSWELADLLAGAVGALLSLAIPLRKRRRASL